MTTTTTETIGAVLARQSVVPRWMHTLAAKYGADAVVRVETRQTPFGNYVLSFAPDEGGPDE